MMVFLEQPISNTVPQKAQAKSELEVLKAQLETKLNPQNVLKFRDSRLFEEYYL